MFGAIEALRAHGFLPGLLSKAGRAVWEPQALVHLVKKKKPKCSCGHQELFALLSSAHGREGQDQVLELTGFL